MYQIASWLMYIFNFLVILIGTVPGADSQCRLEWILFGVVITSQVLLGLTAFMILKSNPQEQILTESEA